MLRGGHYICCGVDFLLCLFQLYLVLGWAKLFTLHLLVFGLNFFLLRRISMTFCSCGIKVRSWKIGGIAVYRHEKHYIFKVGFARLLEFNEQAQANPGWIQVSPRKHRWDKRQPLFCIRPRHGRCLNCGSGEEDDDDDNCILLGGRSCQLIDSWLDPWWNSVVAEPSWLLDEEEEKDSSCVLAVWNRRSRGVIAKRTRRCLFGGFFWFRLGLWLWQLCWRLLFLDRIQRLEIKPNQGSFGVTWHGFTCLMLPW